jgi:type II secretory pathway component PulC
MRAIRPSVLLLITLAAAAGYAADLLSAIRLADTIITGERRIAIIETSHGEQRFITEGETVAGCLVKHIRVDGVDLECRGRVRSLGFAGRARSAAVQPAQPADQTSIS